MTSSNSDIPREDVLNDFAVERDHGRDTLLRYLLAYPQFADDLIDLSRELARVVDDRGEPPTETEAADIESAWRRISSAGPGSSEDPLGALSAVQMKAIAAALDVPRVVLSALKERRVLVHSIPAGFIARLASCMQVSRGLLASALAAAPVAPLARQYRSDKRPEPIQQVTFERILIESAMPEEKRAALLSMDD